MKLINMTPNLMVNDVNESIRFYTEHLGFETAMTVPDEGVFDWALMKSGDFSVMFQSRESLIGDLPLISGRNILGGALFYFNVENIHAWYEKLKTVTTVLTSPTKAFYGAVEFTFLDNSGYIITFAEDED